MAPEPRPDIDMTDENNVRIAAQSIYDNINIMHSRPHSSSLDLVRSHSINIITEEFLGGYMQDGRMSVVRRFFCLFVTFDLFFISLLWLICILITGDNIYNALKTQVLHYTIYKSLFDIVVAAICRFLVLILFYAILCFNHWIIIALSTSGSCFFLISKVFVYDWLASTQPVFQVVLIVTSFVIAWGEAWFLDCRVIPQERHARSYFSAINACQPNDRSPLLAPFLASEGEPPTESIANFYSPIDSSHNSDEEDAQDDEYREMGKNCIRKSYELLQSSDWKIEKVTSKGDTIQSTQRDKLGKVYRLTGRIKYPAKLLLEELFYKIEDIPKWNLTLLESKIVRKIDSHTDISYQATVEGARGVVKSRDFVNLRSWGIYRNGKVLDSDDENDEPIHQFTLPESSTGEGSVSTISTLSQEYNNDDDDDDDECLIRDNSNDSFVRKSTSVAGINEKNKMNKTSAFHSLSKSLGAKDFQNTKLTTTTTVDIPPLDEEFSDAKTNFETDYVTKDAKTNEKLYITAAFSIDYAAVPKNPKYCRGENLITCFAMREIDGKPDACIFEWLLCLDLKGYVPRYILDAAYKTLMQDYMTYLRKYCNELRQKNRRKVPPNKVCS